MTDRRSNDSLHLIKKQVKVIEEINSYLFKTEALINLGIHANFLELSKSAIYEYLSIMKEFVSLAISNIEVLDSILSITE